MIDINKYLGTWHEIARIPNEFQPNMVNVTAEYLMTPTHIDVINSAYVNGKLLTVRGIAKTTNDESDTLLITFDNEHYSHYKILAITEDYKYSIVGGDNENHLWLLGRTPVIDVHLYYQLLRFAESSGYNAKEMKITK